jgi:hypothetical protein
MFDEIRTRPAAVRCVFDSAMAERYRPGTSLERGAMPSALRRSVPRFYNPIPFSSRGNVQRVVQHAPGNGRSR